MFQQIIIIGNVGRDPEFKYIEPNGVAVCSFSVAVSKVTGRGDQRQEKTTWFRVTVWREQAEVASQLVRKGQRILIVGEVSASAYLDQSNKPAATLEITASNFRLLSPKKESEETAGADQAKPDEF